MKKLMTMACAALIAISANAQCNETKNEVKTIPFTQTKIDVPARVNFVVGDRFGFSVEAGDEVLSNLIECSVKDGVLTFTYGKDLEDADVYFDTKKHTIYYAANASEFDTDATDDVEYVITITAPIIPEVTTSSGYEVM